MSLIENEQNKGGNKKQLATPKVEYISLEDLLKETKETKEETDATKTVSQSEQDNAPQVIDEQRQNISRQTVKERETIRLGQVKYFGLRDRWSWFIFGFIGFMLVFQLMVTACIGFGWMDFSKYTLFLHIVMAENFAQIIGMGYIVAKYLFPNNGVR